VSEADHDAKADEAAVAHDPEPKSKDLPETFWLTRDRLNGRLLDVVEVWLVRPEQMELSHGDIMWKAPHEKVDKEMTWWGSWTVTEAKRQARTIPDTKMECIRIGRQEDVVSVPLLN
jgi:hypothetical protein